MKTLSRRKALEHLHHLAIAATATACAPKSGAEPAATPAPAPAANAATLPSTARPESAMSTTATSQTPDTILKVEPLTTPWQTPDPFLFCMHHDDAYPAGNDQYGPVERLSGRNIGQDFSNKDGWSMYHGHVVPGFPQHPHRGFETVTVVRQGLLDHADSLGAAARYGEGDVQWLTAGGGIQHSEMFPLLKKEAENPCELFQIWLNLPAKDKMVPAYFSMLWAPTIPHHHEVDAKGRKIHVTTVAGTYNGTTPPPPPPNSWASHADADVAIWSVKLEAGATWTLPAAKAGSNRNLYFFSGKSLNVGQRAIPPKSLVVVKADAPTQLTAGEGDVEVFMLQGRPIGEPVVQYGPFVMNTRLEIQNTIADFQRTRFGGWPWPRLDPVHGGKEERFAKRPDGAIERPA